MSLANCIQYLYRNESSSPLGFWLFMVYGDLRTSIKGLPCCWVCFHMEEPPQVLTAKGDFWRRTQELALAFSVIQGLSGFTLSCSSVSFSAWERNNSKPIMAWLLKCLSCINPFFGNNSPGRKMLCISILQMREMGPGDWVIVLNCLDPRFKPTGLALKTLTTLPLTPYPSSVMSLLAVACDRRLSGLLLTVLLHLVQLIHTQKGQKSVSTLENIWWQLRKF